MDQFDNKLEARKIPFEFPDDIKPQWIPNDPELSAMINGASLTMPFLEPFLMRTIREVKKEVRPESKLASDISGFIAQEGQHYTTHQRFNNLLKLHYPELEKLEQKMTASYDRLKKRPLRLRMAYTAGFEAMTLGLTKWAVEDRARLFLGSDTRVTSFVLWHMVEETEHKRVAHDAYAALYGGGFVAYVVRAFGVFHGSFDVMRFSMQGYKLMLQKDGLWTNLRSRLRLARRLGQFVRHVGPYLLRAALPWHTPYKEKDVQWVLDWLRLYPTLPEGDAPLIDTNDPDMPVPFATK